MTIEPIAIFHSPFKEKFGIPRQSGIVDDVHGTIVFQPEYADRNALRGIEAYDYLWLIWGFSANKPSKPHPTVRPPRLGGNERIGVFASRSPFRPNGLGLSSVRLLGVEDGRLIVGGADLMDGTPIFDIKPYLPYADSHPEARGGFTDKTQWRRLDVVFNDDARRQLSDADRTTLTSVLQLDPRPHYQDDPDRIYGIRFGNQNIKFRVEGNTLTVIDVE